MPLNRHKIPWKTMGKVAISHITWAHRHDSQCRVSCRCVLAGHAGHAVLRVAASGDAGWADHGNAAWHSVAGKWFHFRDFTLGISPSFFGWWKMMKLNMSELYLSIRNGWMMLDMWILTRTRESFSDWTIENNWRSRSLQQFSQTISG